MNERMSRRELLCRGGMGMGALLLSDLMGQALADDAPTLNPLAPKRGHFPGRAKRVIHIFANGGPSHVDTFDPKPALERQSGKPLPPEFQKGGNTKGNVAFPSSFKFRKYGQSGIEVSELFPNLAQSIDDLCIIRGMQADDPNHEPSLLLMNCGEPRQSRPSMGAWLTYGLGTENQNLPGFIAMCPGGYPIYQSQNWQSGFLPGIFQGTYIDTQYTEVDKLVENVRNGRITNREQQEQFDLLRRINGEHQQSRPGDPQLEARIQSFELAYRMQMDATDAFDVMKEPQYIRDMYGPGTQARQLMIARRLLERGVRFVQLFHEAWDQHGNLVKDLKKNCRDTDRPCAALLRDLKRRGLLDSTLVIWGGEFGRTPMVQGGNDGRDHHPNCFTMWLAGGGVRPGITLGESDEFGFNATADRVHVHDLHATLLHLLGFDHTRLTYRFQGRDFRLTDVHGNVVSKLLA